MRFASRTRLWLGFSSGAFLLAVLVGVFFLFYERANTPVQKTVLLSLLLFTLVFTVLGEMLLLRWMLRPYNQLIGEAERVSTLNTQNKTNDEAEFVLQTFQSVVAKLKAQTSELERLNAKESERAATAEMLSERIVASIPSGLLAFDAKGKAKMANAPAKDLLVFEDTFFLKDLQKSAPELVEMVVKCLITGEVFRRAEISITSADDRKKQIGVTIAPIDSSVKGSEREALCMMTDLTEIAELREQLALKKNLESLGEMSAGLAHEFKNALATLHGYAQLMQTVSQDEKSRIASKAMLQEVRNLTDMVTSFLDFARPKSFEFSIISLDEILKSCADELKPFFEETQVGLLLDEEFPMVRGDERMLRQAFLNLLRNAVEAIDDSKETRAVSVMCANEKDFVAIEIIDTGDGIADAHLTKIFLPFFSTKPKGHGIGLALTHRVITEHGGKLTVKNAQGGGAVFTVHLPLK